MTSWIENDELFRKELATGNKWANFVCDYMNNQQVSCYAPAMVFRDSVSDIQSFSQNDKDIILNDISGHLEVKSRSISFGASMESYPYDTAFVDTLSGWNSKIEKPLAVVLVSQKTQEMLVVPVTTSEFWKTEDKYDSVRGIFDTWITVEKKYLRPIGDLVQYLQSLS